MVKDYSQIEPYKSAKPGEQMKLERASDMLRDPFTGNKISDKITDNGKGYKNLHHKSKSK